METSDATVINSIGIALTLLMCILMLVLPRRFALLPVLVLTCYMSMGQQIVVVGLHFTMIRILVIFGWLRVLFRGEVGRIKLNGIDKALIWWVVSGTFLYCIQWQTSEALINRSGYAYNALGLFFLFRILLRDRDDVDQMARMFSLFMVPLAILILGEKLTGRNVFAIFGGVSEIAVVRDGVIRCQGPFAHPILAGTFAATNVAFFIPLWWKGGRDKIVALLGFVASLVIIVASGSSGPVMAFSFAVVGFCMWPIRRQMRLVRWGIAVTVIALHLAMKAPVWFLIARMSVFDASTGFFRARLIDATIRNFSAWWLMGIKTTDQWGPGLFDITNEYIAQGVHGGLLTMVLFVMIISRAFGTVGRTVRGYKTSPSQVKIGAWAMGCALLAHCATYLSVSYFDQNIVTWFLLLAVISNGPMFARRETLLLEEPTVAKVPREELGVPLSDYLVVQTPGPVG
jgi:hypothetical protein